MLQEIPISDLFPYIQTAFKGDEDLPQYHISPIDFAGHTYNEILKTAEIMPLTCYKVDEFGFTVTSPGLLYSFGINIEYRTPKILKNWYIEIQKLLGSFECILHGKNNRAIRHLIKQGMNVKEQLIVLECQPEA